MPCVSVAQEQLTLESETTWNSGQTVPDTPVHHAQITFGKESTLTSTIWTKARESAICTQWLDMA
jgi:hypothetical protein